MSDLTLLIRAITEDLARKAGQELEAKLRDTLPAAFEARLAAERPGETIRHYSPSRPTAMRRMRSEAILAEYNGRNGAQLAKKFGMSVRQIYRIVKRHKEPH